jgi:hypothetical protein
MLIPIRTWLPEWLTISFSKALMELLGYLVDWVWQTLWEICFEPPVLIQPNTVQEVDLSNVRLNNDSLAGDSQWKYFNVFLDLLKSCVHTTYMHSLCNCLYSFIILSFIVSDTLLSNSFCHKLNDHSFVSVSSVLWVLIIFWCEFVKCSILKLRFFSY